MMSTTSSITTTVPTMMMTTMTSAHLSTGELAAVAEVRHVLPPLLCASRVCESLNAIVFASEIVEIILCE